MNRKIRLLPFILILLIYSHYVSSQVIGSAFLENKNDHSNIKIKFIPQSPTANLDSAYSNADGSYAINLSGGLYKVLISKPGYQSILLNNSNPFPIADIDTLPIVTLKTGNIVFVSGDVSGQWTRTNIYIVNGNLQIPSNQVLEIESGTQIRLDGNYLIDVNGTILANGKQNEQIVFTSNIDNPEKGDWDMIELSNSSNSILDFCVIEFCNYCINFEDSDPIISNSIIRHIDGAAIKAHEGRGLILNNEIYDFRVGGIWSDGWRSNNRIECNDIGNGNNKALRCGGTDKVFNNTVHHIITSDGIGIRAEYGGTPIIDNNIVHHCSYGIIVNESTSTNPKPTITNNLVYQNEIGLGFIDHYADGIVVNNLIIDNGIGIKQSTVSSWCSVCSSTPSEVSYNLFWNNDFDFESVEITGLGSIVTENANGDPIDPYFNVATDPLILSYEPFILDSLSPLFNAGDTNYSSQIGYLNNYNCQLSLDDLDTALTNETEKDSLIQSSAEHVNYFPYPNPSTNKLSIKLESDSVHINNLEISSSQGKSIINIDTYNQGDVIDISDFEPGLYFLKFFVKGKFHQKKIIKF